jgi:hypothetical protein
MIATVRRVTLAPPPPKTAAEVSAPSIKASDVDPSGWLTSESRVSPAVKAKRRMS